MNLEQQSFSSRQFKISHPFPVQRDPSSAHQSSNLPFHYLYFNQPAAITEPGTSSFISLQPANTLTYRGRALPIFGGQSLPGLLFCFVFYFSLSFFPFSYSLSGKTTDPSPAIQSTKQTFQLFVIDPEPDCSPTHPLTQPRQAATSLVSAGVVYSCSVLTSTSTNYG